MFLHRDWYELELKKNLNGRSYFNDVNGYKTLDLMNENLSGKHNKNIFNF